VTTHALDHHSPGACPNCSAEVSGNFCQQCGQETVLHPPSITEFLHEFIGHYVALESKLWQTLRLLILKPGRLTLEYMEGRRVRYIQPLRVYLTLSLIFFALFKTIPFEGNDDARTTAPPAQGHGKAAPANKPATPAASPVAAPATSTPRRVADDGDSEGEGVLQHVKNDEDGGQHGKQPDKVVKLEGSHKGFSHFVAKLVQAAVHSDNGKLKAAFFGYTPYAIFALMPLFALYLKILYLGSGRRYGEHLLFALHTNAFAFLMLAVMILLRNVPWDIPFLAPALFFWLAFYLPFAMRRVYGGRRRTTFLRWGILMLLHLISMAVAITLVLYAAVSH
jgi:hypothetical protein